MSTTIAAVAGTNNSGLGNTRHAIYATNSGNWWAFAWTGTQTLATYYSPDNTTWTAGATRTLDNVHSSEGRNLSVGYKSIGTTDVVYITITFQTSGTSLGLNVIRATISGTTLTFHSTETTLNSGQTDGDALYWAGAGVEFASNSKVHVGSGWADTGNGSLSFDDSTVDAGTAEQMTPVTWTGHTIDTTEATETRSNYIVNLGSATMGCIADNGATVSGTTGLEWATLSGSTWSVSSTGNVDVTGSISSIDRNDWGAVAVSSTDVHVVYRSGSNTFVHRRYNGSSWGAGQTVPNQTSLGGGGVALTTDGVSVWMSVIDTDASNTIRTLRWSSSLTNGLADAWDSTWTATETSSQTRTWIGSPRDVSKQVGLVYWSEGSNLVAATFVAVSPPDPPWIQTAQGSSGTSATTFAVTFSSQNISAGNRIIVCVAIWNTTATTVTSVTDSAGNIYLKDSSALVLSDNTDISIWSAPITVGVGTKPTVTAHASAATTEWSMYVHEYAVSNALTNYTDGSNGTAYTSNPSPSTSGASTPAPQASGELALGYFADGGDAFSSLTPSAGWTQRGTSILSGTTTEGCVAEKFTTAGTGANASFVPSFTGTVVGVLVVVYKLAPAGIGYGAFDPNLNPMTMPGSPYAQMIWVAPAFVPAGLSPAVTGMILQGQSRRLWALLMRRRVRQSGLPPEMAVLSLASPRRVVRQQPRRQRPAALPLTATTVVAPTFIPGPSRQASPRSRPQRRIAVRASLQDVQVPPEPVRPRGRWLGSVRSRAPNVPPWYQAAPNTNQPAYVAGNGRRRPWLLWLRRSRPGAPPSVPDAVVPSQRPRWRFLQPRRRAAPEPIAVDLVPTPKSRGKASWVRRVRGALLPLAQAAAAPNPTFIDVHRRLVQRYWTRPPHGRTQEPPWGQAIAAPNPAFTDWVARRFRWLPYLRRAAQQLMPWGQPAQPPAIVIPPARARRTWPWPRPRRSTAPPDVQASAGVPRRRAPWSWRSRRPLQVAAPTITDSPVLPRRRRPLSWVWRRPATFPWPQSPITVPIQPIVLTIITRSMGALVRTRDAASSALTRSMSAVAGTRDMVVKIVTRSGSSRTNTRG